jgi:hypothetical protein
MRMALHWVLRWVLPYLPAVVAQLVRASLFATAGICWVVVTCSWLAERRRDRQLGAEMYVMF